MNHFPKGHRFFVVVFFFSLFDRQMTLKYGLLSVVSVVLTASSVGIAFIHRSTKLYMLLWQLLRAQYRRNNCEQDRCSRPHPGPPRLPRWLSGKESICQCRTCRFSPWVRKIPWRRKWQPTAVFLPGESHRQRSLTGHSLWGCQESNRTELTDWQRAPPQWSLESLVFRYHANDCLI